MKKRVVITGIGAVTPIGIGKEAYWEALKLGTVGVDLITSFDTTDYVTKIAAEVKDFEPDQFMAKKEAKRMDRYTQFAVAASKLAIDDSKLDLEKIDADRFGVVIGSGIGGLLTLEEEHKYYLWWFDEYYSSSWNDDDDYDRYIYYENKGIVNSIINNSSLGNWDNLGLHKHLRL